MCHWFLNHLMLLKTGNMKIFNMKGNWKRREESKTKKYSISAGGWSEVWVNGWKKMGILNASKIKLLTKKILKINLRKNKKKNWRFKKENAKFWNIDLAF